jgi:TetR/AcrR family transcriptional regulator of autoinduction and epiphytic fitness
MPTERQPDPRVERSRQVILRAALAQLGAAGYGAFTIESVAARAGVGKSTIYRHWPDKLTLIADAFETAHTHAVPPVEALTAREGLQQLLRHVAEVVIDSAFSASIPALIEGAERDPRLREFRHRYSAQRRQSLTSLIRQGMANGEFLARADPELAAQALLGPIFYQRLMTSEPFDPGRAGELIDTILGRPPEPNDGQHSGQPDVWPSRLRWGHPGGVPDDRAEGEAGGSGRGDGIHGRRRGALH